MLGRIQDNGIGIVEKEIASVFKKYYRIDRAVEGSGIGLYLIQQHVQNAGSKIVSESEPDKGSILEVCRKAK